MALIAAVATPPDPFSMLAAMTVMIAIYELVIVSLTL
jgi:Sec-independent protein secretion pathway component TatC